ncbi:MAG: DNA mismatch repair protein MutS [Lachnospiraceae bacterium]|nr:DNA mismatch repair protein MutS [Lachnospiraceae bacterium]
MMTPMMQHYLDTKKENPDCILFYRLGDFYEMFYDDAITVSRELELTLTGKDCGMEERAPMCGVPYHAVEGYLARLVEKGYKVAIAEQMEDPKLAKGLVKREVVRIVTPGTNLCAQSLDESRNNYIMCIVCLDKTFGVAVADVSTGDFQVTEVDSARVMLDEILKFAPSEILSNEAFCMSGIDVDDLKNRLHAAMSTLENRYFNDEQCEQRLREHFHVGSLAGLGLSDYAVGTVAAGALLGYLYETQKVSLSHLTRIRLYQPGKFMVIDTSTRRNLELTETMREKQKRGTLLWVLDKTRTAMGARMLRRFLEQPLIDKKEIRRRQDAVEELNSEIINREELREYLNPIYDLERLIGRIIYHTASPRDLISLKNSLNMLPHIKSLLASYHSELLTQLGEDLDSLEDLADLIERSIEDDPPLTVREGGIIKEGYSEEADRLRHARTEGKQWLADLEQQERERTGIKNLRIKFNKVFGYYLEVTNSFKNMVPDDYVRKQTMTKDERYTNPRLKELEDVILGAEDKLCSLEYDLFCEVRETIAAEVVRVQNSAKAVACIDVLASLAYVAEKNHYVRPSINEKGIIDIQGGRHPVVERMMTDEMFIANDTYLDNGENRLAVITGPNMAGKSTYMRQTALIVLMAQIGSFVPADAANIGICDRIFTRVGASDDLASGQSTFMVEMTEVANILRNATRHSLLILDEIGRGTSTFDRLAIAWAVIEHISNPRVLGAKTLFATHYHELTELEGSLPGVKNYCIAVKEQGDTIVFLRKIVRGGADKSYGIQVAKLAGVPDPVIRRAKELVEELSDADITVRAKEIAEMSRGVTSRPVPKPDEVDLNQMSLFDTVSDQDILEELDGLELSNMTPIDALNTLYRLQTKRKNRWQK